MKLSSTAILALAISSVTATAYAETQSQAFTPVTVNTKSAQAEATGFVEGQSITGTTRNWYANEQLKRGAKFKYQKTVQPNLLIAGSTGYKARFSSTTRGSPKVLSASALKWRSTTL